MVVDDYRILACLVEAILRARSRDSAPMDELLGSPSLFPVRLGRCCSESLQSNAPRLEVIRHGLDHDLVLLRK